MSDEEPGEDFDDFEEVSQHLRSNAEGLLEFAQSYQSTTEKLITFLARIREANHFEEGIYDTMVEKRRQHDQ